jgi:hypothetical protein
MTRPDFIDLGADAAKRIRDGSMTEREWRASVKEIAAIYGWQTLLEIPDQAYRTLADALCPRHPVTKKRECTKPQYARILAAMKGWTDLFLGNPNQQRAVLIELKTEKGDFQDGQQEKIELLQASGLEAYVVRPRHVEGITQVLRGQ